jgi:type IX secretion system PorP/SprF family membrane protein
MKLVKIFFISLLFVVQNFLQAQETLPIYSDYLSDNVFLVHPSAAGIGNCAKLRLTARSQWAGVEDAPSLQTISAHTRLDDNIGVGVIVFNDKNGYHSQQGVQGTFAYHIGLGRQEEVDQVSFGLSLMVVNNNVDESNFVIPDPVISQIVQSESYFNADFSMAYHKNGFFSYFTAKNILLSARNLYNDRYESLNLRRYLVTLGYYYGEGRNFQLEPSIMAQTIERTGEKFVDFNFKIYKDVQDAQIWAAFSYRKGFDNAETEELNYLTPIVGVNYNKFMVSYTYTKQSGEILFDDAGYHQITLGYNFGCRPPKRGGCPNINASF